MPRIDTVELFIGEAGGLTGWHAEDLNFGSVNYLQSGKPKFWVAVSYTYQKQLRAIFKLKYPELYKNCQSADLTFLTEIVRNVENDVSSAVEGFQGKEGTGSKGE
ncbi:hypothetical protein DAPPUDRAFT_113955 [Daphnia pulex]|uniref:JmjC domain-containing protein n=1 Tax=Daphnia pulex TaxID=6669 RepID=E9HGL7_DAPPU|nr:hypothetical protein DAPPUDRAFT_113955 [Daphnia pulex]|eukprot:EFX69106.1 hypothetical protein DAPPUDRAFT_113955 [Daphnia pulex]